MPTFMHCKCLRPHLAKVLATALLLTNTLFAQAQLLYQVEVIVFANNDSAGEREETWPLSDNLGYPANTVVLQPENTTSDMQTTPAIYTELPLTKKNLSDWRDRLRGSQRYRVLSHTSWLQPAGNQNTAKAVVITGGTQYGEHFELEGSIQVKGNSSPFKLQTNLWMNSFISAADSGAAAVNLPKLPTAVADQNTASPSLYAVQRVITHRSEDNLIVNKPVYLDHPLLGVLIKISEYNSGPSATAR